MYQYTVRVLVQYTCTCLLGLQSVVQSLLGNTGCPGHVLVGAVSAATNESWKGGREGNRRREMGMRIYKNVQV